MRDGKTIDDSPLTMAQLFFLTIMAKFLEYFADDAYDIT
jgi:hypothetical protein